MQERFVNYEPYFKPLKISGFVVDSNVSQEEIDSINNEINTLKQNLSKTNVNVSAINSEIEQINVVNEKQTEALEKLVAKLKE